ncbi:MAG: amidophosphoribosyltransferase [Sphingomonas bacterium]|uniref:ComF family protein n=1 Tax=Sphingomonas bacterium TaxID=1895847 RepID=UPI002601C739|nr:ComF family protein [Sphingomonas bacterium]MDB5695248.1 amidophosphoribosyltransferase [Sphingomonas bacterium]
MWAVLRPIADFALPPRCGGCGVPVGEDSGFCMDCWGSLRFIGPPWCAGCHLPFDFDAGPGARCDDCLTRPPRHAGVSAAVAYGAIARKLALKLKYGGRMGVAETMAALMVRHMPADADLLVPVPLHRWRLWSRGYNQAGLIAAGLARRTGVEFVSDLLARTRRTPVLKGLSGRDRRRAVDGAFAVTARVAHCHVVLVDDVYTSGATVDACTAALLDAGAARVSVLCWARVLSGDD